MEIIEYTNCKNCDVVFENGFIVKNREYSDVKKGAVKNLYYPEVLGVGYIGSGDFSSKTDKKHTAYYKLWRAMLQRCYDKKYQEKQPTYKECTVVEEWHNFQNFAKWCKEEYNPETMEGWQLDKDILVKGNKIYSPETCCFVPHEVNKLFSNNKLSNITSSIGVGRKGEKYTARLSKNNIREIVVTLDTEEEAFQAYKIAKEKYIKEIADKYKSLITIKVYEAMYSYTLDGEYAGKIQNTLAEYIVQKLNKQT